ncbi:uncharacterized protein N7496_005755 [Penicillium cataractarum]|uniref:Transcription factor domain-containing protein n=1 Tax=Penicillium cataractarum TaxID=2100454 RepID=A0A9W9SGU3_9EURO|nr:uncharacterized protein N7496_005755 [Penicillium cataractarum]KAJ5378346.1 hypothetical protein N7496_005755 [Penicillium cataractarum]
MARADTRIAASPDPRPSECIQFLARFLDSFCPGGYEFLAPSERSAHFWVRELFTVHGQSALLDTAFSTLATTFVSQSSRNLQLQRQAAMLYDRSLRELGQTMSRNEAAADNRVLASIMCLAFAEVFSPLRNQEHGWIAHNKGACEIIMSRGDALLKTELGRSIFLRFRISGLYAAIGRREAFSLAGQEFSRLSRFANANYFDFLVEEMMSIPQLLKDMKDLATETVHAVVHSRAQKISIHASAIMRAMFRWLADFRLKNHPHPCVWFEPLRDIAESSDRPLYSEQLKFPNLLVAQAMIHYWATMIILLKCVLFCAPIVGNVAAASPLLGREPSGYLGFSPANNANACRQEPTGSGLDIELIQFADAIACSVRYCTSEKAGAAGPLALLFPLWVAKDLHESGNDTASQQKSEYCLGVFRTLMERGVKFSEPLRKHSPPQ